MFGVVFNEEDEGGENDAEFYIGGILIKYENGSRRTISHRAIHHFLSSIRSGFTFKFGDIEYSPDLSNNDFQIIVSWLESHGLIRRFSSRIYVVDDIREIVDMWNEGVNKLRIDFDELGKDVS